MKVHQTNYETISAIVSLMEVNRNYCGGVQALGGLAKARSEVENKGGDQNRRNLAIEIGAPSPEAMAAERGRVEGVSGIEMEEIERGLGLENLSLDIGVQNHDGFVVFGLNAKNGAGTVELVGTRK